MKRVGKTVKALLQEAKETCSIMKRPDFGVAPTQQTGLEKTKHWREGCWELEKVKSILQSLLSPHAGILVSPLQFLKTKTLCFSMELQS